MFKKESSLDRVLGRIDNLDTINLTNLVQKLARERSLLETIFNTALEGMLVIDRDGVVRFANKSGQKLVGLKEADVGESSLWRLIPGLKSSLGLEDGSPLEGGISTREMELTYPERRFVRFNILPFELSNEEGALEQEQYLVILTDITRDKLSQSELIESERVSSILLLAAGVAHELGNPLNSLTIHLQLIQRQLAKLEASPASEKLGSSVDVCREEVVRLDGIIRNFLEAIRPQQPDFQVINLHEILEGVLQFQSNELKDRGIEVQIEISGEPPIVLADKNQLKQAFFNIVKNAMEAMQPGGILRIKTYPDDERFYLQFGDTGSGINHEDLSNVFEPYHTTKKSGTGLGLMIVQRIMREHGGQIGIDSKEGFGTVVTLSFPKRAKKFRMLESGQTE